MSNERKYCSANYDNALETVLEDHDWGFASKYEDLALLKESTDDNPPPLPWLYEYDYPSDCIKAREIQKLSDAEDEIPFRLDLDDDGTGKVIHTDREDAKLRYTKRLVSCTLFSPKAIKALGLELASRIVIPLTGNLELKQTIDNLYEVALSNAEASNFNENVNRKPQDPETITSRS